MENLKKLIEEKKYVYESNDKFIEKLIDIIKSQDEKIKTLEKIQEQLIKDNKVLSNKLNQVCDNGKKESYINLIYKKIFELYNDNKREHAINLIDLLIENYHDFNSVSKKEKLTLLFIAYVYNKDMKLLKVSDILSDVQSYNSEVSLYKLIQSESKNVSESILSDTCINKLIIDNMDNFCIEQKILNDIVKKNYKYVDKVFSIEKGVSICDLHKRQLQNKKVFIKLINNVGKNKFLPVSVQYCDICKAGYITNENIERINKRYSPFKVKVANDSSVENIVNDTLECINSKIGTTLDSFNNYSESRALFDDKDTKSYVENASELELNTQSEMNKLGYSIKVNRNTRLRILKEKAIPTLGKNNVLNHLKWLIKFNGSRRGMENALNEWKYDLYIIQREIQ